MAGYAEEDRRCDLAEATALAVQVRDAVAQVIELRRATGGNRGQAFDYRARFLSVWLKKDGEWHDSAYFSVALPAE
jgi:hypothetical protein